MSSLYPTITFSINVPTDLISYLHPDRHQTDQDAAQAAATQHATLKSTFFPGLLVGENVIKNPNGTFTVAGEKAIYLKNNFTTGANAYLTVVTNE